MKSVELILFILFTSVAAQLHAQTFTKTEQQSLDSLEQIVHSSKTHDTVLVSSLLEIANFFYLRDPDSSISLALKAEGISEKIDYNDGKSNSYGWLGYLYQQKGEINKALTYSLKSLELVRKKGDIEAESVLLNNIGYIFQEEKEFDNALEYYRQGLAIQQKINDHSGIAVSYNNIGLTYNQMGYVDSAVYYYKSSMTFREKAGDPKGIARTLTNISAIFKKENKLDSALVYIKKSVEIDESIVNKDGLSLDYFHLASIYALKGDLKKAIEAGERSLEIAKEIDYPGDIAMTADLLSRIYENDHNDKKALEMYRLYNAKKDLLDSLENKKELARQFAKYEYEKQKVIDDERHKKEILKKETEEKQQKLITYTISGGLLLVIAFLFIIFRRLKITQQQKLIIEEQKQDIVDSINYAQGIQSAILPTAETMQELLPDSFVLYLPKDIVAGDFYWVEKIGNTLLFAVADCTGHGVPGAMVSVVCHNALKRATRDHGLTEPAAILDKTREIVIEQFERSEKNTKDGMDIALCALEGNTLKFSGANNPLLIIREGQQIFYKADRQPIGSFDSAKSFTETQIRLEHGDQLYLYSDGYADQFGGKDGKKMKSASFKRLLEEYSKLSVKDQEMALQKSFTEWKEGYDQVDDVCVMGMRIL